MYGQPALASVPAAPAGPYGLAAAKRIPWPLALLLLTLVMPPEISVMAGPIRISPYRLVLMLWFFPCLLTLAGGRIGKVMLCDVLMLAHVSWAALAMLKNHGTEHVEAAGIYGIESFGAYLMGRVYIRDARAFRSFAAMLVLLVAVIGVFAIVELLTGRHLLREIPAKAMGRSFVSPVGTRFGLHRSYGPFDHPILYGVFAMSVLSMSWFALARNDKLTMGRFGRTFVVGVAGCSALSSGAFATLLVQMILIGYERFSRWLPYRWWTLVGSVAAAYIFIGALSNRSAMHVFLSYLTFSAHTAYSRLNQWVYGMAEIRRYPLFGIGANDWVRPEWMVESIDNFWLYTTMRYGIPAFIFLAGTLAYIFWKMHRASPMDLRRNRALYVSTDEGRARLAWLFTMIGIAVAAATVWLWNSVAIYFFLMIGAGVWLTRTPAPPMRRVVARPTQTAQSPLARAVGGKTEAT